MLGHWLRDETEGANCWLSVITDLQVRGIEDIFIACIDLTGFKESIPAMFLATEIQRCIIHHIRHRLQDVAWKDCKAFAADQKASCVEALMAQARTWQANEPRTLARRDATVCNRLCTGWTKDPNCQQ